MYKPEKQVRRRRFWRRVRFYFFLMILGWLTIAVLAFVLYFPLFKIKKIKIEGQRRLSGEEIVSLARPEVLDSFWRRLLGFKHWLSWSEAAVHPPHPLLAKLAVDKNLWRGELKITVVEKQPHAIWCENENCWTIDEEGAAFEKIPAATGGADSPLIRTNMEMSAGRIDGRLWPNLKKIIAALKENGGGEYFIDRELQEASVKFKDGPELFFSLRFEPAAALAALEKLRTRSEFNGWQYLDLRVENRIYYR